MRKSLLSDLLCLCAMIAGTGVCVVQMKMQHFG